MKSEVKCVKISHMLKEKTNLISRPPVVVVVGHIDHGKSSLLEAIREDFRITAKESGGITQHIGAYEVILPSEKVESSRAGQQDSEGSRKEILRSAQDDLTPDGRQITFIDTPGHEAFSAMRLRGAKVADIAILVVDASEGVKAQTKEALRFVKEADIPLIVAINKIDKPDAQPEKVKRELSEIGIMVESWGGKTPSCNISAKTKQGISELLETVLLVAEMENLKADLEKPAEGSVIESRLDDQKGPVATLLVQDGILREGAILATPSSWGRAKSLQDFQGKRLSQAGPAKPVIVLGFDKPPMVGDIFKVCSTSEEAQALSKQVIDHTAPNLKVAKDGQKIFSIVLKADVLGSLGAVEGILAAIPQEKVVLEILKSEVGEIGLADVRLAAGGNSFIYGFRVKADGSAKVFAQQKGIRLKTFDIIYDLVQEIRKDMTAIVDTEVKRVELGKFKVSVIFKQGKDGQIIGGKVLEGEVETECHVDIMREEEKIGGGKVKTVQQENKNVGKVAKGKEAALLLRAETKIQLDDVLFFYKEERFRGGL